MMREQFNTGTLGWSINYKLQNICDHEKVNQDRAYFFNREIKI